MGDLLDDVATRDTGTGEGPNRLTAGEKRSRPTDSTLAQRSDSSWTEARRQGPIVMRARRPATRGARTDTRPGPRPANGDCEGGVRAMTALQPRTH